MAKISAVIIALNEEEHIGKCLASLNGIADEIIVVDSFSTDSTEEICNKFNVRFIEHKFEGYIEQKNFALSLAQNKYVLSLDADEELSEELRESILKIKENTEYDGYKFNRLTYYCGRWIRHSGWYPDPHVRLFNASKGKWAGTNPHDKFMMNPGSRVTRVKGDIYHWYCSSFEEHINKVNRFSTIMAGEYFKKGRKAGFWTAVVHKWWRFIRTYFIGAGFLDGFQGHSACSISAYASFLKYVKLQKMNADAKNNNSGK
jgi:glycosyltransferase involved in cell wall biosynthesis